MFAAVKTRGCKVIWQASLKTAPSHAKIAARTAVRQVRDLNGFSGSAIRPVIAEITQVREIDHLFAQTQTQKNEGRNGSSFEGSETVADGFIALEVADEWSSHDGVNLAEWREYVTAGPAVDDDAVRAALMAEENAVCPICGRTFREAVAHVDDGNAPCFAGCHLPDETPPGWRSRHAARPTFADAVARAEYGDDEDEWERWKQRDDVKGGAR